MARREHDRGRPLLVAVTVGAALLGGVLAAAPWAAPWWQRASVVLLGAAIGTVLAVPARSPGRPAEQRIEDPVLPPRASAEGLAGAVEQPPLIAQCPRCGEFRLDVVPDPTAYHLRCLGPACGHAWQWVPGTPWPPVVVRRDLAGPGNGPRADTTHRGEQTSSEWGRR